MRRLPTVVLIILLMIAPTLWAAPSQKQAFLVHDATMDNVVWLLWAILVIQLILSVVMLIHTIQMNRWLRVRHFLFSQQIARNQQVKAKPSKQTQTESSSPSSPSSQTTSSSSQSQPSADEGEVVEPQESAHAQINQKMADFESKKSKRRKARSSSSDKQPSYAESEAVPQQSEGDRQQDIYDDTSMGDLSSSDEMPSDDANASRLDLAKAYIEMGEYNRAQQLLNKVLDNTTSAANQAEAQYWLDVVADKMNE